MSDMCLGTVPPTKELGASGLDGSSKIPKQRGDPETGVELVVGGWFIGGKVGSR